MCTRQASNGVEQNDDVLSMLDEALGLLDHHFGHLHMPVWWLVERRADDFGFRHRFVEIGHLFGSLVDEKDDERDFGVIVGDGVGHLLQQDRFARARRRDNESALSLADGGDEIDDPH